MRFFIVDVFAEAKYEGNELAVLIPDREVSDAEMQQIAREINFSETTFILSGKQPDGGYPVRIFTPVTEVPFAGHPTLGTAHIIRSVFKNGESNEILLNMKAGQIPVREENGILTMTQNQPVFGDVMDGAEVAECFFLDPGDIREDFPVQWVSTGLESVIIPLKRLSTLTGLKVDHPRFQKYIERKNACNHLFFVDMGNGILRARNIMEEPGFGEDPATGSANGNLAGYMLKHDYFKSAAVKYTVLQGVEMGRPSVLYINASLSNGKYNIRVGGRCVTVAEGDWK